MEEIQNAVTAAIDGDVIEFKNSILNAINAKVSSRLEDQKIEMASTLFGDQGESSEEMEEQEW